MKNYMQKKFRYHQIFRVVSRTKKEGNVMMRQIVQPYIISGVPQGCFVADSDGLLLPKRRRGEKFIVNYTVMVEEVL